MMSQDSSARVAVIGASGFVGSAVIRALREIGASPLPLRAPRLAPQSIDTVGLTESDAAALADIQTAIAGVDVVVNCAGMSEATSPDENALLAANGVLPLLLAIASENAGCRRFIHVSSAVVQGDRKVLDESENYAPFSPYGRSKVMGEVSALHSPVATVYRPPGVHGNSRAITRKLVTIARSPVRSVAAPGNDPTPQAHIENVASAVAFLATCALVPPRVVIHPWEGLTTAALLRALGQKEPRLVPRAIARASVALAKAVGRVAPRSAPHARRLELMWFGQRQARSWLEEAGWRPSHGLKAWDEIATGERVES